MGEETAGLADRCRIRFRQHWALNEIDNNRENRSHYAAILRMGLVEMEREFETLRRIMELRLEGCAPTEIERRLRMGPTWMWRSKRQVEYAMRPSSWVFDLQDSGDRQGDTGDEQ